jgi:hypothetical protein
MRDIIADTILIDTTIKVLHEFLFVNEDIRDIDRGKVELLWSPGRELHTKISKCLDDNYRSIRIFLQGTDVYRKSVRSSIYFRIYYVESMSRVFLPTYTFRLVEEYYQRVVVQVGYIQLKIRDLHQHIDIFRKAFDMFINTNSMSPSNWVIWFNTTTPYYELCLYANNSYNKRLMI